MLRKIVLAIALLLAAAGLWLLCLRVWSPGSQLLILGGLVFGGTALSARWRQTDQKFADPISSEGMDVQYDPVSGERRYVRR